MGVSGPNFSARTGDAWVNGEVRIGDRWYTHWGARRLKDPTGKRRKLGGFGLGLRRATFRLLHCSICLWASVDRYQKVFHQKQSVDSRALEIERTTLQCRALDIVVANTVCTVQRSGGKLGAPKRILTQLLEIISSSVCVWSESQLTECICFI